jgi:acetyl-CoA C-acetyltransferase
MWQQVAQMAADDAGNADLIKRLDAMSVVYCQSWPYDDPVGRLADRLGAAPRGRTYSGIGGTVPLQLLAEAVSDVQAGRCDSVLVVGAEALATRRAFKKGGERAQWSYRHPQPPPFPFERMPHDVELAHEVFQAWETFPLFDVARRAARGDSLEQERVSRGQLMARMTEVAAANPHAWFPVRRSPDELGTITADNRIVGWPYPKYQVSVMDVDMAAAVLIVSADLADELGIPGERRAYLRGYGYAEDPWTVAEHADLTTSPAMRWAARSALTAAGVDLDQVGFFDLYSCFASSLRFACDCLDLDPLDPRGLTVTGGLPFAGGPASNYTSHAVASMVEQLRRTPGATGVVSGVGMHMTKHAYSVWSTQPGPLPPPDDAPGPAIRPVSPGSGQVAGTVAAYTVAHARDGAPASALLIVDLPDGSRTYARALEPDLLADAESRELVGTQVRLRTQGAMNIATW